MPSEPEITYIRFVRTSLLETLLTFLTDVLGKPFGQVRRRELRGLGLWLRWLSRWLRIRSRARLLRSRRRTRLRGFGYNLLLHRLLGRLRIVDHHFFGWFGGNCCSLQIPDLGSQLG